MNKIENPIRCPTCNKILKNKPYEYNGYCCYACWKNRRSTKNETNKK